jgi:hypothetical protein
VTNESGPEAATDGQSSEARPVLRVVRGEPTPAELAALVAVLAARSSPEAPAPSVTPSLWRDRASMLRAPLLPGPGSWRASGLPR